MADFQCICNHPYDINKVIIGENSGLVNIIDVKSQIITQKEIFEIKSLREIKILSKKEIVGISYQYDIYLFEFSSINPLDFNVKIIGTSRNKLIRILPLSEKKIIISCYYGDMLILNKEDNEWIISIQDLGNNANFALNLIKSNPILYICNNYKGTTRLYDYNQTLVNSTYLDSNLQEINERDGNLFTTDYFGKLSLFSFESQDIFQKSNQPLISHIAAQIDCSNLRSRAFLYIFNDEIIGGFQDSIWKTDLSLSNPKKYELNCQGFCLIENNLYVLTKSKLIPFNSITWKVPENYIQYQYIKIGIIGASGAGKSTLCKFLSTGEYIDDIGSTSGVRVWTHVYNDERTLYYYDIAGQEDEIKYYLNYLKGCHIFFILVEKKQGKTSFLAMKDLALKIKNFQKKAKFYLLLTKSDDKKTSCMNPERYFENLLDSNPIEISTKTKNGIDKLLEIVFSNWNDISIPVYQSKIVNTILSQLTKAIERRREFMPLSGLNELLPSEYSSISKKVIDEILVKKADEGLIYYHKQDQKIILNTFNLGITQSKILNIFADEMKGIFYYELVKLVKIRFKQEDREIPSELEFYIQLFLIYLKENKFVWYEDFTQNMNPFIIFWDFLPEDLDIETIDEIEYEIEDKISKEELCERITEKVGRISGITKKCIIISDRDSENNLSIDISKILL